MDVFELIVIEDRLLSVHEQLSVGGLHDGKLTGLVLDGIIAAYVLPSRRLRALPTKGSVVMAESSVNQSHLNCIQNGSSKPTKTISDFLWVAVPKIGAGLGQLIVNYFLIRNLSPGTSGVIFVCVTTIILLDAVLGAAVDVAVIKLTTSIDAKEPPASLQIQKAALISKIAACLAIIVPTVFFVKPLSGLMFHKESEPAVLVLSMASMCGLLTLRSVQTCFQIDGRFWLLGSVDIMHSLCKFSIAGVLLYLGRATPVSILTAYAVVPLGIAIALLLTFARQIIAVPFSWHAAHRLGSAVKWYLGSAALGSTNSRMDIIIVSAIAGTAEAGVFSAAQVLVMPIQLIGMYFGVVFAPRIMPLWRQGRLPRAYYKFQALAAAGSLVLFAFVFFSVDNIPIHVLPPSYLSSRNLVLFLLPAALAGLINFPWTISFLMFTHPRFLLLFELFASPFLIVLYRVLVKSYGATGAAALTGGFAIVKTLVYQSVASIAIRRGPVVE